MHCPGLFKCTDKLDISMNFIRCHFGISLHPKNICRLIIGDYPEVIERHFLGGRFYAPGIHIEAELTANCVTAFFSLTAIAFIQKINDAIHPISSCHSKLVIANIILSAVSKPDIASLVSKLKTECNLFSAWNVLLDS